MNIIIAKSNEEREDAFKVRRAVFIDEQGVPPHIEMDEHDATAIHFVGYRQNYQPITAGRLRWIDHTTGKLERVCVLKQYRGKSYGRQMILKMEQTIKQAGYLKATLHAQVHAKKFYEQLGYEAHSEKFMDAGIPHVEMIKYM